MSIGISQILEFLKRDGYKPQYRGRNDVFITGFSPISIPKSKSLVWIKNIDEFDTPSIEENLELVIVTNKHNTDTKALNVISVATPRAAYFALLDKFFSVEPTPFIAPNAVVLCENIGQGVSVGYNCFIDRDVVIGARTIIRNNVVIQNSVRIGMDCVVESGTIIGVQGFGYYDDIQGQIRKVPDFGGVEIGDRVTIGANSCIARGTLGNTIIRDDVKIDNLVHIAHNVFIDSECMIIAQSLIGGSARLGKRAYVAPCAAVMNQIEVGEHALVGMGAVVTKNVEKNKVVAGVPARVLRDTDSTKVL